MVNSFLKPRLGLKVDSDNSIFNERGILLIFISTFCSRCLILKKMIKNNDKLFPKIEKRYIDVANTEFLEFKIKINSLPSILLIKNKEVLLFKEGLFSSNEISMISELSSKLFANDQKY
ncbi:MAG: hypothetical protein ACW981_04685 [Candidatus Hodarchaeales archaeon]|jgi:thioredoxin-related protein